MLPYYPALRFKQGEYIAGSRIARDVQSNVQPRFIIPPPNERDPERGVPLTLDEIAYLTGERIGKHWPLFPAFLDPQHVAPMLDDNSLITLFRIAQGWNKKLVAVATPDALFNPIYKRFVTGTWPKLGVYVRYDEIDADRLKAGLDAIDCSPRDCVIFVDFAGAELSPDIASSSVSAVFEHLSETAQWGKTIFQGSTFPATNPADPNEQILIPRNEWKTFLAALKECSVPLERIGYGDYGADSGEIDFPRKAGGGRPIPHLRYTTETDILVVRGRKEGSYSDVMVDVFNRLLNSGHFAGPAFSYADDEIWRRAKGISSCGNASMWREWNTAHHMTRVVRDLGAMSGVKFKDSVVSGLPLDQPSLFGTDLK